MGIQIHGTVQPGASLPAYGSVHSAGADLRASLETQIEILPGRHALVPTGLRLQIPLGYEGQVRPRSGLAAKHGVTVLNSPGTIDSDYRGEIKVILINLGETAFTISHGDRIAQLIIAPVVIADFAAVSDLEPSERGEGGFGSTGV
ncbi:MAG: dUTP diphosphatase [Spirochaetales bacterium]|nr:dUTP diphosphatase [Spirochaetales bacterium]